MIVEMKRYNYVTPTKYLELVKGYLTLLAEKRRELGNQRNKLSNGLQKLEEGKSQVETMSKALEKKKVIVASSQKECEELLVIIVSEKRVEIKLYDCEHGKLRSQCTQGSRRASRTRRPASPIRAG